MYKRFEKSLISHCAATLAGHKAGSLFSYRLNQGEDPEKYIAHINETLGHKGMQARLLKYCSKCCLVYAYRPALLEKRLRGRGERAFLERYGYTHEWSIDEHLSQLSRRIYCGNNFPHEIGLFLDYPLSDVEGFISNRGCNYCCVGCWKVYSDEDSARRRFALYEKCRQIYLKCYKNGFDVLRLTVAA